MCVCNNQSRNNAQPFPSIILLTSLINLLCPRYFRNLSNDAQMKSLVPKGAYSTLQFAYFWDNEHFFLNKRDVVVWWIQFCLLLIPHWKGQNWYFCLSIGFTLFPMFFFISDFQWHKRLLEEKKKMLGPILKLIN